MRYLTTDQILAIHAILVDTFGGLHGIRDLGLLESALARPQAGYGDLEAYPTLPLKAAALCHSLVKNHPFLDGNKRTAVVAMETMLNQNGVELILRPDELFQFAIDVATDKLNEKAMAAWIEQHMA